VTSGKANALLDGNILGHMRQQGAAVLEARVEQEH
jgi:hypothetical protein